jgi:hypothetical protein
MDKNRLSIDAVADISVVQEMLEQSDARVVYKDAAGTLRFNSNVVNAEALIKACDVAQREFPALGDENVRRRLLELYEETFKHSQFTGRSGGMFGFEGLGCVYWHMISKLLLAVQEVVQKAHAQNDPALNQLIVYYYKIREGIGYNKTPEEYGAFPTDPYSHTPKHAGAQQPGMTGQVKEEIITRFGELGCQVKEGKIFIDPFLLRPQEFVKQGAAFSYLDVNNEWQSIDVHEKSIAFTWCQVPFVYRLDDTADTIELSVSLLDESTVTAVNGELDASISQHIFERDAHVRQINVLVPSKALYQP